MRTLKISSFIFLLLAFSLLLQAGEFQVKIIAEEGDQPERFCSLWTKGDILVSNGNYLVLIGGTPRTL